MSEDVVSCVARELLRCHENYNVLDSENNRLKEIESAAKALCEYAKDPYLNQQRYFELLCALDAAVKRNEQAKNIRRKKR